MKSIILLLLTFILIDPLHSQITTPVIRANFGVDADLRANYFNGFIQAGNDDWFNNGTGGPGQFVIDTSGAAAIVARYAVDPAFRRLPFFRTMRFAPFSIVNNRTLIDAVFIRDYHGDDSTIFASGSNKNGDNPSSWTCPVSQSIPDKNDILDMFVHVRRAGPTSTDSLWMFGGLSIENTTGNRYFDFEMYQTDIYYNRPTRQFFGYGPDDGHTSWEFDASGNITKPGDIIFTAEYGSSTLTLLQARIWVNQASLSITPQSFSWNGLFDGASAGSTFGYAGIQPKTAGAFYAGLQSVNNTWGGPFSIVRDDNSVVTNYIANQFMEFSVNLTKLGLDPVTLLGGSACGMPFRRILVKTRASTAFTAELKDFVGPFDLFLAPRVAVAADVPIFCNTMGVSTIQVTNPVSTSVYLWSTPNGNIVGSTTGTSIQVDTPGMYIVIQQLQSGCSTYASDTVVITFETNCGILEINNYDFRGVIRNGNAQLSWTTIENSAEVQLFTIERSMDGINFSGIEKIYPASSNDQPVTYNRMEDLRDIQSPLVYYRLKITTISGSTIYSKVIRFSVAEPGKSRIKIAPNPVTDRLQINVSSTTAKNLDLFIYDCTGKLVRTLKTNITSGNSMINVSRFNVWPTGMYAVRIFVGQEIFMEKIMVLR